MKLTILGTGNATVTECYNTCFALSEEGKHFLVDCGGGNRILKVLKETKISLEDVHDIFITHEHADPYSWNCVDDSFDRNQDESGKL